MSSSFGGSPRCPTCDRPVYAAEQTMGPGRKLYHKPCLKCKSCSKRLDSFQLVEHDGQPYCKNCHLRNFSTKDLRHANLPQTQVPASPPTPPPRRASIPPSPRAFDLSIYTSLKQDLTSSPGRKAETLDAEKPPDTPIEMGTTPMTMPPVNVPNSITEEEEEEEAVEKEIQFGWSSPSRPPPVAHKPSIYSRVPVSHVYSPRDMMERRPSLERPPSSLATVEEDSDPESAPSSAPSPGPGFHKRIVPMSTGGHGRYTPGQIVPQSTGGYSSPSRVTANYTGGGLTGPSKLTANLTGGPFAASSNKPIKPTFTGSSAGTGATKYGYPYSSRTTIECPKCGKAVYHAEQVNAIGKKWHKNCLRCTHCATSLDSTRLTERDGEPYCKSCYSKLYGPRGAGYALLGKAGA